MGTSSRILAFDSQRQAPGAEIVEKNQASGDFFRDSSARSSWSYSLLIIFRFIRILAVHAQDTEIYPSPEVVGRVAANVRMGVQYIYPGSSLPQDLQRKPPLIASLQCLTQLHHKSNSFTSWVGDLGRRTSISLRRPSTGTLAISPTPAL